MTQSITRSDVAQAVMSNLGTLRQVLPKREKGQDYVPVIPVVEEDSMGYVFNQVAQYGESAYVATCEHLSDGRTLFTVVSFQPTEEDVEGSAAELEAPMSEAPIGSEVSFGMFLQGLKSAGIRRVSHKPHDRELTARRVDGDDLIGAC